DIAGLVKGASEGEGLGNRFLAHIRECDAIAMVVRGFEDDNVTHVGGRLDPGADVATVDYELMLADREPLGRRKARAAKRARQQRAPPGCRSLPASSPSCATLTRPRPPSSWSRWGCGSRAWVGWPARPTGCWA